MLWVRLEPPNGDGVARRAWLSQKQQELIAKLTPSGQPATAISDIEYGRDRLLELLADRAVLLVVDNVWLTEDVHAFNVVGRRGALVLTTRDVGLVRGVDATELEVAELTDEQARALAATWAGLTPDTLASEADEVLAQVGNLALGVATVAAIARDDRQRWAEVGVRLRAADLAALRLQFPGYPHPTLLAALRLGLDYLEPDARVRYSELAVFAGHGAIPRAVVETLWEPAGLSPVDVGDLLAILGDRALLTRSPDAGPVELHDLRYDVARIDIGVAITEAHQQLLDGYTGRCPHGWASGPDDGYFYQHLVGHLIDAGCGGERAALVSSLEWMRAHLRAGGVSGLLTDYRIGPDDPELDLVRATLRLSAHILAVEPDQLPAQLVARTIGRDEPVLSRLHTAALNWPGGDWLCPVWSTLTQAGEALQQTLTGHIGGVSGVAVSADGRTVISGGLDGSVRVWDPSGAAAPGVLGDVVSGMAVSADGRTVVSSGGYGDETLQVWGPPAAPRCPGCCAAILAGCWRWR